MVITVRITAVMQNNEPPVIVRKTKAVFHLSLFRGKCSLWLLICWIGQLQAYFGFPFFMG